MPRVEFKPSGVAVHTEPGASLLEAARRAGVRIRNDCGGRGACGRCIIRIQSGDVARLSTRFDLKDGEDLACRTLTLDSDVVVFVPEASREAAEEVSVRQVTPLPADTPTPESLIKRIMVEVPPPSLEDNVADADRLVRALRGWREGDYDVPLGVLRDLPTALRETQWNPHVTLAAGPCGASVLNVGDGSRVRPAILAVDIGTTAIKAQLLAPKARWQASCYNSQVMYGPDVISRIIYCQENEGGLERMQNLVVGNINQLLAALLEAAALPREDVWAVVTSGNTTMTHLLLGLHPVWIRREPYVGCSYHLPPMQAAEVGIEINPLGRLFCLPSVSSYVGSDIVAGVLATGLSERTKPAMLIDLGTNGEIVIGCSEYMVCCSASAGPAFEGQGSASGSRAMPGAVDEVWWEEGLRWHTIDDAPAVGICGSGYIDLLATLLRLGVIDRTGRFQEGSSDSLRPAEGDEGLEYVLVPAAEAVGGADIVLTQGDIGNLVRAKGAIYAAASVLLGSLGFHWSSLEGIMLAGGFGDRIDKENAVRIGLLPDVEREKIEFVGNTSLRGAVMAALDEDDYARADALARRMTYMELSTHPKYMSEFVAACFLPHTHAEEFPSVSTGNSTLGERR